MRYMLILLFLSACGTAPIDQVRGAAPVPVVADSAQEPTTPAAGTWGSMQYVEGLSIFYAFDSADVAADSELNFNGWANLKRHAAYLKSTPSVSAVVVGNCDERGSAAYNYALGLRRADSVKQLLLREGVSESQLSVRSDGKSNPVANCHAEQCWRQNRRVNLEYRYELK